jgi:SP family myo-inositol transporter-like MFS transporter 13
MHYNTGVDDTISTVNRGRGLPHIIASDNPIQSSTRFVYLLTFLSAIGGFLFGYDTGVVSGAMILLRDEFQLSFLWQELVVSITIGAAALFALIGGFLNELLGRKPVIVISSFVFTLGAVLLGLAYNREMLLAGRAIVGVGIGECRLH